MDSRLKAFLKVAAAVILPGAAIVLVLSELARANERREFQKYIHRTYGEGSNYVDTYNL